MVIFLKVWGLQTNNMPKLGQELCQTPLSIFGSVLYQVLLPWLTINPIPAGMVWLC